MPDVIHLNRFRKNRAQQSTEEDGVTNRPAHRAKKPDAADRTAMASGPPAPVKNKAMEPAARIIKHSLSVSGHQTSVSLEEIFWRNLKMIAVRKNMSVASLVAKIDRERGAANLSSAIRVHVLEFFTDSDK